MMIKLELELTEVNALLQQLAEGPYRIVQPLIAKIHEQATPQAAPKPPPAPDPA